MALCAPGTLVRAGRTWHHRRRGASPPDELSDELAASAEPRIARRWCLSRHARLRPGISCCYLCVSVQVSFSLVVVLSAELKCENCVVDVVNENEVVPSMVTVPQVPFLPHPIQSTPLVPFVAVTLVTPSVMEIVPHTVEPKPVRPVPMPAPSSPPIASTVPLLIKILPQRLSLSLAP